MQMHHKLLLLFFVGIGTYIYSTDLSVQQLNREFVDYVSKQAPYLNLSGFDLEQIKNELAEFEIQNELPNILRQFFKKIVCNLKSSIKVISAQEINKICEYLHNHKSVQTMLPHTMAMLNTLMENGEVIASESLMQMLEQDPVAVANLCGLQKLCVDPAIGILPNTDMYISLNSNILRLVVDTDSDAGDNSKMNANGVADNSSYDNITNTDIASSIVFMNNEIEQEIIDINSTRFESDHTLAARLSIDQGITGEVSSPATSYIKFDTILGTDYNCSTGEYTIPATGIYLISTSITVLSSIDSDSRSVDIAINRSIGTVFTATQAISGNQQGNISQSAIIALNEKDIINLQFTGYGNDTIKKGSTFNVIFIGRR